MLGGWNNNGILVVYKNTGKYNEIKDEWMV